MKKYLLIAAISLVILLIIGYATLTLSSSRTFQFFGGLTNRVNANQKVIALTFDDAPGPGTHDVLRELDKLKIKATFFAIGGAINEYPADAKSIVAAGHELGNHTYAHYRMIFKTPSFIQNEIERTDTLIRKAGYGGEILFRPPNGKKLILLPWYLKQHNRKTIMWDIEPNTYREINGDTQKIIDFTVKNARPGSIILLHPFGSINAKTRAAIPGIVIKLQQKGYRFVTVSELLSSQNN